MVLLLVYFPGDKFMTLPESEGKGPTETQTSKQKLSPTLLKEFATAVYDPIGALP